MSPEAMLEIKLHTLGGAIAAKDWNDALNALHKYAQASNCPPGRDVVEWFSVQSESYRAALSEAICVGDAPMTPSPDTIGAVERRLERMKMLFGMGPHIGPDQATEYSALHAAALSEITSLREDLAMAVGALEEMLQTPSTWHIRKIARDTLSKLKERDA